MERVKILYDGRGVAKSTGLAVGCCAADSQTNEQQSENCITCSSLMMAIGKLQNIWEIVFIFSRPQNPPLKDLRYPNSIVN